MDRVLQNLEVPIGRYKDFKSIYISDEVMVDINTNKRCTVGQKAGKVVLPPSNNDCPTENFLGRTLAFYRNVMLFL